MGRCYAEETIALPGRWIQHSRGSRNHVDAGVCSLLYLERPDTIRLPAKSMSTTVDSESRMAHRR